MTQEEADELQALAKRLQARVDYLESHEPGAVAVAAWANKHRELRRSHWVRSANQQDDFIQLRGTLEETEGRLAKAEERRAYWEGEASKYRRLALHIIEYLQQRQGVSGVVEAAWALAHPNPTRRARLALWLIRKAIAVREHFTKTRE